MFTAKIPGLYYFSMQYSGSKTTEKNEKYFAAIGIRKNYVTQCFPYNNGDEVWASMGCSAVLELNTNDKVDMAWFWSPDTFKILTGDYTTFSGFLI